jgi:hypothetical protein
MIDLLILAITLLGIEPGTQGPDDGTDVGPVIIHGG